MPYFYTTMALSTLFFIISGIQMWASDYFREVLEVDEASTHIAFAMVCVTAPAIGALFSGIVVSKFGGHNDRRVMPSVIVAGVIAMAVALPVPHCNNFYMVVFLIWLLLILGSYILPILTGVMLTTVPVFDRP